MTTGINTDTSEVDVELERMLGNLRFRCMGPDGLIVEMYEYYKEKLLSMYTSEDLNDDVVIKSDNKESTTPVEQPSIPMILSGGPMDSAWPMFGHDSKHTGLSPYSTADNPEIEKWRFAASEISTTPAIADDGTIYVGGALNSFGRYLIAINPNGTEKWRYETGGLVWHSSPAIAEDGTIYIGSWDGRLYAINPDGTKKWHCATHGSADSSPAIGEDGTIYIGGLGSGCFIVAINPNGTEKWKYKTGDDVFADPVVGDDGTVYCGSNDKHLYAINPNGTLKWKFKTGKAVGGSASIADDGTVYAHGTWDYLYALYPNNGSVKWKYTILCNSNPSIDSDGIIYTGGNGKICAIYPNGTKKWTFDLGNERWTAGTCPAISSDGTIYVSVNIGIHGWDGAEIIAINSDGTLRWRKKIANDYTHSSPSIAEDGTVYIGSAHTMSTGYLHAFGPQETNVPPTGPTITGPTEGKTGTEYEFIFKATDPDRNPVSFYIEWDDGTTTGWTKDYASGEKVIYSHSWSEKGNYTIKAKAKDTFGLEGDWSTFEIGISKKSKAVTVNMLLVRILERFPLLERLYYLIRM
jgi:outer membrane protein assembly factor BamB